MVAAHDLRSGCPTTAGRRPDRVEYLVRNRPRMVEPCATPPGVPCQWGDALAGRIGGAPVGGELCRPYDPRARSTKPTHAGIGTALRKSTVELIVGEAACEQALGRAVWATNGKGFVRDAFQAPALRRRATV